MTFSLIPDGIPGPDLIPDEIQFAENPEPRCACVLLLDVSESLWVIEAGGVPFLPSISTDTTGALQILNDGIATFETELKKDELASLRVEIAILTFGDRTRVVQDFVTVDRFEAPKLSLERDYDMSEGINLALDKIEERKQAYRDNGIDYYRPWLFVITDGASTGNPDDMLEVSLRLRKAESEKAVAAFAVTVANEFPKSLELLFPRRPLKLKGLDFGKLFVWLSQSMSRVSASRTDDEIRLDTEGLKNWADI